MELTRILREAETGDEEARAEVLRIAYQDLRALAARKMQFERQDHTLTATALVHEVTLKLLNETSLPTTGRAQFMAYAAKAMRHYLVDHARTAGRQKRGGDRSRVAFDNAVIACHEQSEDLLELHSALEQLAEVDARKAKVVEMRYFGGLSLQETAEVLCVSVATVKRDWEVAKVWLKSQMTQA